MHAPGYQPLVADPHLRKLAAFSASLGPMASAEVWQCGWTSCTRLPHLPGMDLQSFTRAGVLCGAPLVSACL